MPEYRNPQNEPGMDRNLLFVFLLMAVVIFGSQLLFRKNQAPQPTTAHPNQQQVQPGVPSSPASSEPSQQPVAVSGKKAAAVPQQPTKQASSESQIVIENDLYKVTFSNRGAQAKSWILKKFSDDQGKPLDLVNLAAAAKYGYPLSLWTYDDALRARLNSSLYLQSESGCAGGLCEGGTEKIAVTPNQLSTRTVEAPVDVIFDYSDSGLTVRKTFHFDHSYVVRIETSVLSNGAPVLAFPAWPAGFGDQTTLPGYAAGQFEYQVNTDVERVPAKKISGDNTMRGTFNWAGVSSTYFAAIFIPDKPEDLNVLTLHNAIDFVSDPKQPNDTKPADVIGIAVGRPGGFAGRLFAGPKALDVLDSVPVPSIIGAEKDLRKELNFGWFAPIARPLFAWRFIGLRWFHGYVHNWGWAIVIQTLIINVLLFPLVVYQMKSQLKMQKVQPQMKAIQEKYKKYSMRDPRKQEMQREIADLYKQHGVNPVSGCLPLLVQLPFLYAYYRMLGTAIDLRQAHWLWIHDLSASDWILPLVMALSMFLSQRMTPQPGIDPAQQRMMNWMMPAVMGVLFFRFPAGLNLYYAESNFIRMAQQSIMNRTELGREIKEIAAKRARKKDK
jgi:YidC/Oxa1 family membrane protein insertase